MDRHCCPGDKASSWGAVSTALSVYHTRVAVKTHPQQRFGIGRADLAAFKNIFECLFINSSRRL